MTGTAGRILFWAPRILAILFAAFLALFAFDVFGEETPLPRALLAFAMHLVPTFLVLLLAWLSWRREWIGVLAFAALAAGYAILSWKRFPWTTVAVISGPLLLLSVLFLLSRLLRPRGPGAGP